MRKHLLSRWFTVATLLMVMTATPTLAKSDPPLVVGSTNFTEQLILANIYAQVLEDHGVKVNKRLNLGSREIVFPALTSDEIDLLPEYTGTLLGYLSDGESKETDSQDVLKALRKALPEGIIALEPSPAEDVDGLVVTRKTAQKYHLESYSDLAKVADKLVMGGPPEVKTRYATGLDGMRDVYGIEFKEFLSLDAGGPLTQNALASGRIDVGRLFTTQGVIAKNDWVVLEDDKHLIPAQQLVPIARAAALDADMKTLLNKISAALTTRDLQEMNKQAEIDHTDPEVVVTDWIKQHDLK